MNVNDNTMNREDWLTQASELLNTLVFAPAFDNYNITPEPDTKIAVSIGHPKSKNAIGECWARRASEDGKTNQIFITPFSSDSLRILDVLAHEMSHAYDDNKSGHKNRFAKLARAIGLDGKLTATFANPQLTKTLQLIIDTLGDIPHTKLDESKNGRKKQTGRMIKIECNACEFKFHTSRLQISRIEPTCACPACGVQGTFIDSIITALENA